MAEQAAGDAGRRRRGARHLPRRLARDRRLRLSTRLRRRPVRRLLFAGDTAFTFPDFHRRVPAVLLCCDVKLEFSVADFAEVLAFETDDSLLLRLSAAPLVYYRTAGDDVHDRVPFHLIDVDDDPWIRTTDVTPSGAIGRCSAYRVSFAARFWPTMRAALDYMKKQVVPVDVCDSRCRGFTVLEEPDFGRPMHDVFFCLRHDEGLRFPELYLVNVLIHNGIVNPHQLTSEFFSLLRRAHEDVNVAALTELFGAKLQVCNDPCSRLKNAQDRAAKNLNHLLFHSSSRKAGDYNVFEDSMSCPSQQMTTVYRRVQTILTEGFTMCGRKYSFLAFSTSQVKQKSAWFFAEDGSTTVASIREWMGQFPIRNPAKHAARMGLYFTSSYATVTMQPCEVNEYLEDVIHNGYNFSDGIGMIMQDLALEVAEMLPLTDNYASSAYQIRYAGFKGVVAVSTGQNDGMRMSLRPSMRKFESAHCVRKWWLMGCLDELGILEQGQCFIRVSAPSLNNCYVNRGSIFPSEYKNNAEIIVGTVVMAKNPCLHPGDVRILEAVDVPELHHLVDCLVFPKKGERPHANEASGSDLDGDIYFVTWDENLVPPGRKSCTPMDYSPAKSKQLPREVHQQDTIDFYLESMVNDNLGRICNVHVAHADRSDDGAMDQKCSELAELAAIAVDSAKTGEIVRMPPSLSPKEYPDFMGKEDAISYKSKNILGRLYRSILGEKGGDFQGTCVSNENQYDTDLEVPGALNFLEDAWKCKCLYEAQLNTLLNQYGVHSEAELVTGEIWSLVGYNKKYQYQLKLKREAQLRIFQTPPRVPKYL
ncbi:unnamed protein product [Miscanthus lutarioriparius]|uniref:RNA-dependent RNA polymerase n=1 Tax=Miscanthus lutarioriparius TaxID=422564 RepID=A0A811S110_9POAL|nr:unnamed protein product [Miscanthus lutarioriparius]